jgi:ferredoxin-NADP reductase
MPAALADLSRSAPVAAERRPPRSLRARAAALLDGFAWPLRVSHYLEMVNPLWSADARQARVEQVVPETEDAHTLVLRPGRGWRRHRAGQFVALGVTVDGARHTRTYSISSPPEIDDGRIAITVQAIPGGRVSQHLVRATAPGAYVTLGLPQGDFVLPEAAPVRPLFVTAGSGITPVMSMLRSFAARGPLPDVVHLHYVPHAGRVIFARELARLAHEHPRYRLRVVETRTEQDPALRRFSHAALERSCPDWTKRDVYACGPESLLDAVEGHWAAAGLAGRLLVERFRARAVAPPEGVRGGRVRFTRSGRETVADGQTPLLRVAEDAGLEPAHGCRIGICHTCTARLVAGCVRDVRSNAVTGEPGTAIQLCVSAASGDVEVEV